MASNQCSDTHLHATTGLKFSSAHPRAYPVGHEKVRPGDPAPRPYRRRVHRRRLDGVELARQLHLSIPASWQRNRPGLVSAANPNSQLVSSSRSIEASHLECRRSSELRTDGLYRCSTHRRARPLFRCQTLGLTDAVAVPVSTPSGRRADVPFGL